MSVAKPLTLTCLSAAQSESAGFTGFPLPQAGQRRCRLHILILQSLFLHPSIPQRPVYSPGLWPCHLRDSPDHQGPGDWLGLVIDSPRHRNNKERCCSVRGSDAVSHSVVGIFLYYRPVCRLKIQLTEVGLYYVARPHNGSAPHQKNPSILVENIILFRVTWRLESVLAFIGSLRMVYYETIVSKYVGFYSWKDESSCNRMRVKSHRFFCYI